MIQISRSIIRQFRMAMKKSVGVHCPRSVLPSVVLQTGANGLTIHTQQNGIALAFQWEGSLPEQQLVIPAKALDEMEGRDQCFVELESTGTSKVLARWTDHSVPRIVEYDVPGNDAVPAMPELPATFAANDGLLLKALDDAMHVIASISVRYATDKVQLRGNGEIVGTDGGQLLLQTGFQFPWTGDVLVPHVKLFGCRECFGEYPVNIGKTEKHVCIRCGAWTIFLPIDKESRYPQVEKVIPRMTGKFSRLTLDSSDAAFLTSTLSRLPGNEGHAPVTLDLNGQVTIRARAEDQERATVVTLSRSTATGPAICYATNRNFLAKAIALGFSEIQLNNADSPAMCQDNRRKYVFMTLGKNAVVAASENELHLSSDAEAATTPPRPTERSKPTVNTTPTLEPVSASNDQGNPAEPKTENGQHKNGNFSTLLEEAQSLQNALRDMLLRTNQLITGLKQYHRTTKTVRSTLASLRQLQQIDV